MINRENVNALSLVGELPASTAVGRVPARDGLRTANIGKLGDLALGLPLVLCDETVFAVRAGDSCEGATGFAVAGVVGDCELLERRLGRMEEGDGPVVAETEVRAAARYKRLVSCMMNGINV